MKFDRWPDARNDGQFIETRQHQVEEICRWFGVPPHKVMHLLRATFSNIEHQSIEVVVDSITPWVKIFEEEADYKLFGEPARASTPR
jgi:phage portal protein BeeE